MISDELKKVILRELGLEDFAIEDATVATQVPGWDSLSHVRIISAVEEAFGVRFKALEAMRLRNVGELQALVDRKRGTK
jgi:acyl carrier protein